MDIVLVTAAIFFAAVIGFAVHRASLCNVKAVAELLTTRRALMLGSFFKTVLWVVAATIVIDFFVSPGSTWPVQVWGLGIGSLAGGFVFGVGAALNGGCALGTIGRLGNGDLRMLVTLIGLVIGLVGASYSQVRRWLPLPESVDLSLSMQPVVAIVLTAVLSLWVLWELWRLLRNRSRGISWRELVFSDRYRLSAAALVLGISNGLIYTLFGPWSYTRTVKAAVNHIVMDRPGPGVLYWLFFAAMIVGVLLSSLTRGSFALHWRIRFESLHNLLGGMLMGVGAALTPGGNDVLILHAIPSGSSHALPAYGALLIGTATALMVKRALGGSVSKVECAGDICRTRTV